MEVTTKTQKISPGFYWILVSLDGVEQKVGTCRRSKGSYTMTINNRWFGYSKTLKGVENMVTEFANKRISRGNAA